MDRIFIREDFIIDDMELFHSLNETLDWDTSMKSRKTASVGVAYNYSQMEYPEVDMPECLSGICSRLESVIGFLPNNCLVNYYENGMSRMGFHSDRIDNLERDTGIAIISLGAKRSLRFRHLENKEIRKEYPLSSGSLFYMDLQTQHQWQHAIPKDKTIHPRMSLTFRKVTV